MIKYRASLGRYDVTAKIEEIEIEKETAHFVTVKGGWRNAKKSEYQNYYDTWGEARAALVGAQTSRIKELQISLRRAEERLNEVFLMEKVEHIGE